MSELIELDLGIDVLSDTEPIIRDPYSSGSMSDITNDLFAGLGIFTRGTQIDRLVSKNSNGSYIDIEDLFGLASNTSPVIRDAVNAGELRQLYLGAREPIPGDTMHIIDFIANPIEADFTAVPETVRLTFPVQFTDTSIGNPVSWYWTFGDGEVSYVQNPTHVYAARGVYPVSLTVWDLESFDTQVYNSLVLVEEYGLDFIGMPQQGGIPLRVSFTAALSLLEM